MSHDTLAKIVSGQGVLNLSVHVEWRDGDYHRSEMTRLLDVDPRGATFQLQQRPELGQLVRVTPRMYADPESPAAGGGEGFWALVWALTEMGERAGRAVGRAPAGRHVASVIFFGDDVPRSFAEESESDYGYMAEEEGVFRLQRMPRVTVVAEQVEDRRREVRIHLPVVVTAEVLGPDGEVMSRECAITENVSRRGAALRTTLVVPPDGRVRLTCQQSGFTITSVVRACRLGPDNVGRVHVEFLDGCWPLGDDFR